MRLLILSFLFVLVIQAETEGHTPTEQPQEDQHGHFHSIQDKQFWINSAIAACKEFDTMQFFAAWLASVPVILSVCCLSIPLSQKYEKAQADMILEVLHNHHLLLVTLLLYNAIAMETLPLVIHTIVPAWLAIVLSTCVVLIVGEIVPQALCTGPNKLIIAQRCVPLIRIMIKIFWVVSYPISLALDKVLGQHSNHRLERKDLAALLKMQDESSLKSSEIMLLGAILKLRELKVNSILIPLKDVFMVDIDSRIDRAKIQELRQRELSFVPVYKQRRGNIVALLKTKEFVVVGANRLNYGKPFSEFVHEDDSLLMIYEDTNLMELLMLFEAKKARIALVANKKRKVEAGLNSIYYSKSDMVLQRSESNFQVTGIVALNNVFSQLSGIVEETQGEKQPAATITRQTEMSSLRRPLLDDKH